MNTTKITAINNALTSDIAFSKLINNHLSNLPKTGDIIKGCVIEATKQEILIDIEGYTTGVVRGPEMRNLPIEYTNLKPKDLVEATVIDLENEKGQMELSLKSAIIESSWNYIKEKERNQEVIELKITAVNKGGLISNIKSIPAFLPVSQLTPEHYPRVEGGDKKRILKKLKVFVGKTLSVKIINSDPEEEKIIISEKRAFEEAQKQKLQIYKIGDIVDAVITSLLHFGAFIDFGDNLKGLIHSSEIPENLELKINDQVKAKILDIKGTRVFLSLK